MGFFALHKPSFSTRRNKESAATAFRQHFVKEFDGLSFIIRINDNRRVEVQRDCVRLLPQTIVILQPMAENIGSRRTLIEVLVRCGRNDERVVLQRSIPARSEDFLKGVRLCQGSTLEAHIHGSDLLRAVTSKAYRGPTLSVGSFRLDIYKSDGTAVWGLTDSSFGPVSWNPIDPADNFDYDWLQYSTAEGVHGKQTAGTTVAAPSTVDFRGCMASLVIFDMYGTPAHSFVWPCTTHSMARPAIQRARWSSRYRLAASFSPSMLDESRMEFGLRDTSDDDDSGDNEDFVSERITSENLTNNDIYSVSPRVVSNDIHEAHERVQTLHLRQGRVSLLVQPVPPSTDSQCDTIPLRVELHATQSLVGAVSRLTQ
eukprot:Rmarinus@m.2696